MESRIPLRMQTDQLSIEKEKAYHLIKLFMGQDVRGIVSEPKIPQLLFSLPPYFLIKKNQ